MTNKKTNSLYGIYKSAQGKTPLKSLPRTVKIYQRLKMSVFCKLIKHLKRLLNKLLTAFG